MEYFDNHLQQEFHTEYNSSIPEGLEWDNMKAGISKKIASEDNSSKKKYRIMVLFFFGIIAVTGLFFLSPKSLSKHSATADTSNSKISFQIPAIQNLNEIKKTADESKASSSSIQFIKSNETDQNKTADFSTTISSNDAINYRKGHKVYKLNSKTSTIKKANSDVVRDELPTQTSTHSLREHQSTSEQLTVPQYNEKEPKPTRWSHQISKIDQLSLSPLQSSNNLNKAFASTTSSRLNPLNKITNKSISYSVSSGILFWSGDYKGNQDFISSRNMVRETLPGFHAQLNKNIVFNSSFGLSVGVGYQELFERFETTVDTMVTTLHENVLVLHRSLISGRVTESYNKIEAVSTEQRFVRHLNAFKSIGLELALTKQWKLSSKLSGRASLGTNVYFNTLSSGKTLAGTNTIIEFGRKQKIVNSVQLAGQVGLQFSYDLTNRMSIIAGVHSSKYLTNLSRESDITFKPWVQKINLGLDYSF